MYYEKSFIISSIWSCRLVSAKSDSGAGISSNKFEIQVELLGGWCEIKVYDGNGVLIKYSYTYESSESACYSKAKKKLATKMPNFFISEILKIILK